MKNETSVKLIDMGTLVSRQENMKQPLIRLAADIGFFIVLVTPVWIYNLTDLVQVNKRGFYCSDNSIHYPYKSNTVPSLTLFLIGMPVVIAVAFFIEYMHYRRVGITRKRGLFHPLLVELYRMFAYFIVGANINQILTDTAKLTVGRLRPMFLDVCLPSVDCDATKEHVYIDDYNCTRTEYPGYSDKDFQEMLVDIRKSFPSGHASFAAYCTIFAVVYLQYRLKWGHARMFRVCLQTLALAAGLWTCCTRFLDNKHHGTDIVGGALLGGSIAAVTIHLYYRAVNYTTRKDFRSLASVSPTSVGHKTNSDSLHMEPEANGNHHENSVTLKDETLGKDNNVSGV